MVEFEIEYNGRKYVSTIYDRWDMTDYNHTVIARIHNVTRDDVGKYLKLNDGSNQFVKIIKVFKNRVYTSGGLYFKWETICVVNPRIMLHEYSGAKRDDEHFLISPPTDEEKELAISLADDGKIDKASKRVRMLTNDELKNRLAEKGIDENTVVDKVVDLAFGKTNQHTFNALKTVGRLLSMDAFEDKRQSATLAISGMPLAKRLGFSDRKEEIVEEARIVYEQD